METIVWILLIVFIKLARNPVLISFGYVKNKALDKHGYTVVSYILLK